jgi:DnaJ domain
MTTRRHQLAQQGLTQLGLLGVPRDRVFAAPDLRASRALLTVSAPLVGVIALGVFGVHGPLMSFLALGVFVAMLVVLKGQERWLTVGLAAAALLIAALGGGAGVLLVQVVAVIVCLRYLNRHRTAFALEGNLVQLGQVLGAEWKAYLPRDPQAQHVARVLVSPEGQTFYLGLVAGKSEVKYGTPHVVWQGLSSEVLRGLARRDAGVVQQGQTVLWVVPPTSKTGAYPPTLEGGVTTVVATPAALAQQLQSWSGMVARLDGPTPTASEQGRAVEAEWIAKLEVMLPAGWSMRSNVLLAKGGDADIELTAEHGEKYVIDVKSRSDRMDLTAPKGERAKSWAEIHAQVVSAARQLQGLPLVWQPRTADEDFSLVGEVWCLRGGVQTLLDALGTLGAAEQAGRAATPHDVLGVKPGASRAEIQAAYKALAKQYHPDRVASLGAEFRLLAERRMKAINAAYATLMGA